MKNTSTTPVTNHRQIASCFAQDVQVAVWRNPAISVRGSKHKPRCRYGTVIRLSCGKELVTDGRELASLIDDFAGLEVAVRVVLDALRARKATADGDQDRHRAPKPVFCVLRTPSGLFVPSSCLKPKQGDDTHETQG